MSRVEKSITATQVRALYTVARAVALGNTVSVRPLAREIVESVRAKLRREQLDRTRQRQLARRAGAA